MVEITKHSLLLLCLLLFVLTAYTVFAVGKPIARIESKLAEHSETLAVHSAKLEFLGVQLHPSTILKVKEKLDETRRSSSENP